MQRIIKNKSACKVLHSVAIEEPFWQCSCVPTLISTDFYSVYNLKSLFRDI